MKLRGIHHLTAVSARIRENHQFYTRSMGMRLVKRSVNQDDVSAYHLFYADGVGSPGTDLTFFDWAVPRERRGTHSIARSFLRVRDADSVLWWKGRMEELGIAAGEVGEVDGRATLYFEDPEGQRLALVADGGAGDPPTPWRESPVPEAHQLRGLGPVLLSVPDPSPTEAVLHRVLGMEESRRYLAPALLSAGFPPEEGSPSEGEREVRVWSIPPGGPHAEVHLVAEPELPPARPGAGGVHHVAFRVADEDYHEWAEQLNRLRVGNSGKVDRYYFRSLYFREPNGILFELATDGPGFAVDEPVESLGEEIALPPFLEPRRERIVAGLRPID